MSTFGLYMHAHTCMFTHMNTVTTWQVLNKAPWLASEAWINQILGIFSKWGCLKLLFFLIQPQHWLSLGSLIPLVPWIHP